MPSILVYGAGVIGCTYAVLFSKAGYNVSVYARGKRLAQLAESGLQYFEDRAVHTAPVHILDTVEPDETFDYVFVTVRYEQILPALQQLKTNASKNIVTMVNTPFGYAEWSAILGQGKLIPAFAGAGGRIEDGVLYSGLTPAIVQPTTFGEIDGTRSNRIKELQTIFTKSNIPNSISNNMDAWQKCHLALVTPLANGLYSDGGTHLTTAQNKQVIRQITLSFKERLRALKKLGVPLTPSKLNLFLACPNWLMGFVLKKVFSSSFGETFIYHHAISAKSEMQTLNDGFVAFLQDGGAKLQYL